MKRAIAVGLWFWALTPITRGQSTLQMLIGFDHLPDMSAVQWMRRETADLFSEAGLTLAWRQRGISQEMKPTEPAVSVRFHGHCQLEPHLWWALETGPLASTQVMEGEIRPFIEVNCDRAAAVVSQDRGPFSEPLVTRAFGRALGRLVAHELYHYLTQSAVHGETELFSRVMRPGALTRESVRFEAGEIAALRQGVSQRANSARLSPIADGL